MAAGFRTNVFKLNRTMTKYTICNFSGDVQGPEIGVQEILQKDSFQYVSSIISKDGKIKDDTEYRIRAGVLKWRYASRVLCDWRIPNKIEGNFLQDID